MRYLLLIYGDEAESVYHKTGAEAEELMGRWWQYTTELGDTGKMLGSEALQLAETAQTVRFQGGEPITIDGPFAETKEQLGGFYMIEADSVDDALTWAGKMPNLPSGGSVEVRPIMEFEAPQQ